MIMKVSLKGTSMNHYVYYRINKLDGIPIDIDTEVNCETWPKCPIGQHFWTLLKDPKTSSVAKACLTGVSVQTLHVHPVICTFCPDYPETIFRLPEDLCTIIRCNNKSCKKNLNGME